MESGLRMGSIRGWPVKAAAREQWEGRADGIPGSPARALVLLETGTVTGARRTRATPAGLRIGRPGPRPGLLLPPPHLSGLPSSVKCQQAPRAPLERACGAAPEPQEPPPAAGGPREPVGPPQPVSLPQSRVPLQDAGGCRPPRCPPSSEQGQDWPGVALSQGLTLLSRHLPPAAPRRGQLVSEPVVPHHTSLTQRHKTAAMALPVTGDSRIVRSGLSYIIVTASGFQVLLLTPALNTY